MEIKSYTSYVNEGIIDRVKSMFTGNKVKTEYDKELKQYDLILSKVGEGGQEVVILHNKRLVGNIKLDADSASVHPVWYLTIYFYESEVKKDDKKYKSPDKIDGQSEQPYAKGKKKFTGSADDVIRAFWVWWSTNTKSGKLKNQRFKIKI